MSLAQRSRLLALAFVACLAATTTFLAGLASAVPNPPGNNGTIKLDDVPFDDAPNNEPRVGCTFQVDFYGYDKGDLDADVTFEAHPPTQRATDDQVLLTDTVFIGEDDNAGAGSQAGLDASVAYTLAFAGIEPHPVQGFHVKLTINAEGSKGADVKHKVFWVTGCISGPTTTTTTTTTVKPTTTIAPTITSKTTSTSGATSTSAASSTTKGASSTTAVGGGSSSAGGPTGGGALPFTGAGTMPLLAAGIVLLGLGAAGLVQGSRRSRT